MKQGWELGTAYQERSSYVTEIAVPYRLTLTEVREPRTVTRR
jgi:hypothetical protein